MIRTCYVVTKIDWYFSNTDDALLINGIVKPISIVGNFIHLDFSLKPTNFLVEITEENKNDILIEKLKGNVIGKLDIDLETLDIGRYYFDLMLNDYVFIDTALKRTRIYSENKIEYRWN